MIKLAQKKKLLYSFFATALLFINFNSNLDIIIMSIIVLCYAPLSLKDNLYLYVFFMPFDEILAIPMLGSIYRIFQAIILAKIFHLFIKRKLDPKFSLSDIFLLLFLIIYIGCSIILYGNMNVLGLFINILIVIIIRNSFIDNLDQHLSKIFRLFIFSVCMAIFWGLIHHNFMMGGDLRTIAMMRFKGTQEPNVMALYINISILFLLYLNMQIKKKILLLILLYTGLFLTVSISGLVLNLSIILIVLLLNKKTYVSIKHNLSYFITLLFVILSVIFLRNYLSFLEIPLERFQEKLNYVLQGNFNSATTGRTELNDMYLQHFKEMALHEQIFGVFTLNGNNMWNYLHLVKVNVSHNTFTDMLYSFGVLGLLFLLIYVFKSLYSKVNIHFFKCLLVLKTTLLVSGFTLSMFDSRYFYVWMIL
ncbi:hypothetical protein [Priestia aryabhattai]|uniref:hypothetical protein n=1 Tax=Priestia aryabhattai TaxID=412384 RepID=UPI001FB234CD|nr:hypothetical protein [Priestia aryabhattai]